MTNARWFIAIVSLSPSCLAEVIVREPTSKSVSRFFRSRLKKVLALLAVSVLGALAVSTQSFAQPGVLDPSFGVGGKVLVDPVVLDATDPQDPGGSCFFAEGSAVAVRPDQKILVSARVCGRAGLIRLNPDGTLDSSFGGDGVVTVSLGLPTAGAPFGISINIFGMALQSDGKIVLAGQARLAGFNIARVIVMRFNSDGTLDGVFGTGGMVQTSVNGFDFALDVLIQPDGKIVVAGAAGDGNGPFHWLVVRYNSDGTLDSGFGLGGVKVVAVSSGTDVGHGLALQSDGKIVVTGDSNNFAQSAVVRLNSDGALDTTFGGTGIVALDAVPGLPQESGQKVSIQSDGKIVVAGWAANTNDLIKNPHSEYLVFRLNAGGTLDSGFGTGGVVTTAVSEIVDPVNGGNWPSVGFDLAILEDGRIAVAGMAIGDFRLVLYKTDGNLDGSFGVGGISDAAGFNTSYDRPLGIAVQADGKFVLAGTRDINPRGVTVARYGAATPSNQPPVCGAAQASPSQLWPPNHKLAPVRIVGVRDPDNDTITLTVTSVMQDEPVNGLGDGDTCPDAFIQGSRVLLRAERAGPLNGRVYHINFTADDGRGGQCSGTVTVCVPHDQSGRPCIDDGPLFDSTHCP